MNWFIFFTIFAGLFFLFGLIDYSRGKLLSVEFSKYLIFSGLWLLSAFLYYLINTIWGIP